MTETKKSSTFFDDLKAPFYVAFGAGDLALAAVNDIALKIRETAEASVSEVRAKVEDAKGKYLSDLGEPAKDVRDVLTKFSPEELRKVAEAYSKVAVDIYNYLAERGEDAAKRLLKQPAVQDAREAVADAVEEAGEATDQALGVVASQTRALGEQVSKASATTVRTISPKKES